MVKKSVFLFILAAVILVQAACSKSDNDPGEGAVEPVQTLEEMGVVTLTLFKEPSNIPDETVVELVRSKYPHITFNLIRNGAGSTINDVLTSGTVPDVMYYSLGGLGLLKDLNLLDDLTPLIRKYNFDLDRFAPGVVEVVQSYADNGAFLVMPMELNNNALFYNKDIFDRFGVKYPKDDMTWEELYEVARRVVRIDGGVQYHGFHFNLLNVVYKNQLALPFVDPVTHKAAVNTDQWAHWLRVMTAFYTIEGNQPPVPETTAFMRDQTLAMRTGPNIMNQLTELEFNWDVASLPHFEGKQGAGSQMNSPFYGIAPTSPNKDAAFLLIDYLLSDEVAIRMAREGRVPILKSEAVRSEFGKGIPGLEGKNLAAFFKDTIAAPVPLTPYDAMAKSTFNREALTKMLPGNLDINTVLRTTEEEINRQIEALRNQ